MLIFAIVLIGLSFLLLKKTEKMLPEIPQKPEINEPLERYKKAQNCIYNEALSEIKNGKKIGHWMWFIFPQLDGLGTSNTCHYYALGGIQEVQEYLADPILGGRIREITAELVRLETNDIYDVMDYPDNLKLQSCMTLFTIAEPGNDIFKKCLDKYFSGKPDLKTIELLGIDNSVVKTEIGIASQDTRASCQKGGNECSV